MASVAKYNPLTWVHEKNLEIEKKKLNRLRNGSVSGGREECLRRPARTHPWLRQRLRDSDLNRHHDQDSHSLQTLEIARFHSGLP